MRPDDRKPFGDDFAFTEAAFMFANIDRLLNYMNGPDRRGRSARPVHVRYGTLSEYFALLKDHVDVTAVRPPCGRPQ